MKKRMYRSFEARKTDKQGKNPCTVAEQLLEPRAKKNMDVTPAYIESVMQRNRNIGTYMRLWMERRRMEGRKRELAARGAKDDVLRRYTEEIAILATAQVMLGGGQAR